MLTAKGVEYGGAAIKDGRMVQIAAPRGRLIGWARNMPRSSEFPEQCDMAGRASVAVLTKSQMNNPRPKRISLADLEETRRKFPDEVKADPAREIFTAAVSVVRHFFGHDWYMDHIFQDAAGTRPPGFMRIDYTQGPEGEKKTSRLLDFAENLFNLQYIDGFDDRVDQMRTGDIEATFADFDFARFLYIHDIDFKFVVPSGVAGKDYDFGIQYSDGRDACADAKCRLEGTEMRAECRLATSCWRYNRGLSTARSAGWEFSVRSDFMT